ncbi:hypothetical protein D3C87_1663530 [compost metagenome]
MRVDVQRLLDQPGLAHWQPNHRMGGMPRNRRELGGQQRNVVGAVFRINEDPVESGACRDFGRMRARQRDPETIEGLAIEHGLLEDVDGCGHGYSPQANGKLTVPSGTA